MTTLWKPQTSQNMRFLSWCFIYMFNLKWNLSHWPRIITANLDFADPNGRRGPRRRSAVALPLRLWIRIPPGAWTSVCCEHCVLLGRSMRRDDHLSRGVLPSAIRRWVWSRNLVNEEVMAQEKLLRQKTKKKKFCDVTKHSVQ